MKLSISALILLVSFPGLYAASGNDAHAGWGWLETLGRWVNLLILGGVIYHFVRTPLQRFLRDRKNEIQKELTDAEVTSRQARTQLIQVEKQLENLDAELARIRQQAEQEAQVERSRLLKEAEKDGEKILATARREVDGLVRTARKEIREYAADLSVRLAEEQIRKEMNDEDQERVLHRFLVTLRKRGASPR